MTRATIACCWSPRIASRPTTSCTPRRSPTRARCSPGCRRSGSTRPPTSSRTTSSPTPSVPDEVRGRAMLVERLEMFPVECVVRGYITGSGWKDYQAHGRGLRDRAAGRPAASPSSCRSRSSRPPRRPTSATTTRTSTSTAPPRSCGDRALLEELRRLSIELYKFARRARARSAGSSSPTRSSSSAATPTARSSLGDEVLTPDSSRFWPADGYEPGRGQPTFDKQYVRDWAAGSGWDKTPPAPRAARRRGRRARARCYLEAYERITGEPFDALAGAERARDAPAC